MIVITLSKTPASLRGDLTKWCQEIQTGVYVGTVNAKVRDLLWERVKNNIGSGEATLVYNTNNEIGFTFRTTRSDREVIDLDGIPFLMHVKSNSKTRLVYSEAYHLHKARQYKKINKEPVLVPLTKFVALDIETTGLDPIKDSILSIGAVKYTKDRKLKTFYRLIDFDGEISSQIYDLTGLDSAMLSKKGIKLKKAISQLSDFIEDRIIVGYNLRFDLNFLESEFMKENIVLSNDTCDLLPIIKRNNMFLENYHLNTVLNEFDIENANPHHADSDAESTWRLAEKLIAQDILKF